jgi:hypothetical protein
MKADLSGNRWSVAPESATVKLGPTPGRMEAFDIVEIMDARLEGRVIERDALTDGDVDDAEGEGAMLGCMALKTT